MNLRWKMCRSELTRCLRFRLTAKACAESVIRSFTFTSLNTSPLSVAITSPTEGQTFEEGSYVPISVAVSPSVILVDVRDQNFERVAYLSNGNWSSTKRFLYRGTFTLTAFAYNSQDDSVQSAPVTFSITPINHTITGKITDSLTAVPIEGVTLNLTSPTNTNVTATTTSAADGTYSFIGLGIRLRMTA